MARILSDSRARLATLVALLAVWILPVSLGAQQRENCTPLAVRSALANETVPDFVGCDRRLAERLWRMFRKEPITIETEPDSETPPNRVIAQSPNGGEPTAYLEAGLSLTVAVAPEPSLPDYRVTVTGPGEIEEGGKLIFTIGRSPGEGALQVAYSVRAGNDAQPEVDFAPKAGMVSFKPNETELKVSVDTIDREGENGRREVRLVVRPGGDISFEQAEGLATIIDKAPAVVVTDPATEVASPVPPPVTEPDTDPWWTDPLKLGALIFAAAVVLLGWILLKPKPAPVSDEEDFAETDALTEPEPVAPPDLTAACNITPGVAAIEGENLPLDGPALNLAVRMGWDRPDSPEALPILEVERSDD